MQTSIQLKPPWTTVTSGLVIVTGAETGISWLHTNIEARATYKKQINLSSTPKANPHRQLPSHNYSEARTGNRHSKFCCWSIGTNIHFKYRPLLKIIFEQDITALSKNISTMSFFIFLLCFFLAEVFAINKYFIKQMLFHIEGKFQISSWPINHKNLKILNFGSIVRCAREAKRLL